MDEYSLLQPVTIYKEVVKHTGGYWSGGTYIEGTPTTTYENVTCFWESDDGKNTEVLPEGVRSSDVVWIDTDEDLKTASDNGEDSTLADTVYLHNPETDSSARPYRIMGKWDDNGAKGFELLTSFRYSYLAVRERK